MTKLAKQFFDHTITRRYVALAWGDIERDGRIEGYIGRSQKNRIIMDVYRDEEKGKWSATNYKVLERLGAVTLVSCMLETGRTHQIRAHMKHIGHPLFSDANYGGDKVLKNNTSAKFRQFVTNCFEIMPRQALHAQTLGFIHPTSQQYMEFESPLPDDFSKVLTKWRNYSLLQ
ncbi:Ribosomal large subunit pseudouridine synthase D [compost metagenome]